MVFVGEVDEAAFDATELGGLEGFHGLAFGYAEIFAALDDEDRRVPFAYVVDGVVFAVHALGSGIAFFPVRAAEIPVGEEHFFRSAVHAL